MTITTIKQYLPYLLRYLTVGMIGLFLDMATLIFLKEYIGISPLFAVVINQAFMICYIFFLNKHWSFRNRSSLRTQLPRFLLLIGFNYIFSVVAMLYFNHALGFDYRLVRLLSIAMMTTWNFLLYKHWVYIDR